MHIHTHLNEAGSVALLVEFDASTEVCQLLTVQLVPLFLLDDIPPGEHMRLKNESVNECERLCVAWVDQCGCGHECEKL